MLFGHQLADRQQKGEDIFYFCFYILEFLMNDDFSLSAILKSARQKYDTNTLTYTKRTREQERERESKRERARELLDMNDL
jgi:hypothetical protein